MADKQQNLLQKQYVEEYVDPITGVTGRQLKLGYWWLTHKSKFARIGVILLIVLDVYLVTASSIAWGLYLFRGQEQQTLLLQELAAGQATHENWRLAHKPESMQVIARSVFAGRGDKYDFAAELTNPNPNWLIFFDYRFVFSGGDTPWRSSFLLPGEIGIKTELGFEWARRPREAEFEIQNIKWVRMTAHIVDDVGKYLKDRLDFVVTGGVIVKVEDASNILSFEVRNNTPFSYWRVPFYVGLYSGTRLVAVEYIIIEPFRAGETRSVNIATTLTGGSISDVKLYPEINVFDKSVFLTPQS
ncbi:MAG TPA: hypothetical protein DDW36_03220 [Candidatus Magasanikbacteria bacterium]|nr:hypothetical protein [Candidatus Magasanikbacteria bacterium]